MKGRETADTYRRSMGGKTAVCFTRIVISKRERDQEDGNVHHQIARLGEEVIKKMTYKIFRNILNNLEIFIIIN